ncbi:putative bifunctional diguanylate cyclase/phosphodiesterase [Actinophytocola xanthii]|uniref:GGDEF-domain containing protein n=1 Tax=Actinophytocola xanthii TaxID=1912961 RepID=A0A1Q8CKB2_9PSEU|nr:EAL domain-containing protein [Actinophytocola xanthii]OLF14804.1 hypothetical protein BU204_24900 [Actinophytocola xanthii]
MADTGLRRTRWLTDAFAWFTTVGLAASVLAGAAPIALRVAVAVLVLVVLVWWISRRAPGSWWLVGVETAVIGLGCLALPNPQPALGFLFGLAARRAVRGELGPYLVRAMPALAAYLLAALYVLLAGVNPDPYQIAPALFPLLGLVIGTLALSDAVRALGAARTAYGEVAAANERLDVVLRTTPVALVVLDPGQAGEDTVTMFNDRAAELFEWTGDGPRSVRCAHGSDLARCERGCLARCLASASEGEPVEWSHRRTDGSVRTIAVHSAQLPEPSADSRPGRRSSEAVLLACVDVSAQRELADRLRRRAERDELTGAASRAHFTDLLRAALDRGRPALLLIDLDDFKEVNDAHGHPVGDQFLVQAAGRIGSAVGSAGVVGRLGGDEFAVLVEDGDQDRAGELAERVLAELAIPASIGIALASGDAEESADVLLRDADTAMYTAKRAGGNRFQLFHAELRTALLRRQQDEAELRQALVDEQFVLYFQPIVDLRTGTVSGAEALIRWQHPERGLLPPAPLVELAEETGLIVPLGTWALRAACRQAVRWHRDGIEIGMSVNVSARQLHTADFVDTVDAALRDTGLAPERLTLELTESALVRPSALEVLRRIRALGVRVALDDFGTGYSSLSYLQRHPFDLIKIDRSFTGRLGGAPAAAGIVRCVLDLAAVLGTPVVGEGVETVEQARFLASAGCALAQGYHFGRPVPPSEFLQTVQAEPIPLA